MPKPFILETYEKEIQKLSMIARKILSDERLPQDSRHKIADAMSVAVAELSKPEIRAKLHP